MLRLPVAASMAARGNAVSSATRQGRGWFPTTPPAHPPEEDTLHAYLAYLEVDYLARWPGGEQQLVQACANIDAPATPARVLRALQAAGAEHPRARRVLVVLDKPAVLPAVPAAAEVVAALDWWLAG